MIIEIEYTDYNLIKIILLYLLPIIDILFNNIFCFLLSNINKYINIFPIFKIINNNNNKLSKELL